MNICAGMLRHSSVDVGGTGLIGASLADWSTVRSNSDPEVGAESAFRRSRSGASRAGRYLSRSCRVGLSCATEERIDSSQYDSARLLVKSELVSRSSACRSTHNRLP